MPEFRYTAVTAGGEMLRGVMQAADAGSVIARLRQQGSMPIRAELAGVGRDRIGWLHADLGRGAMRRGAVTEFFRELATMLDAGQDLDRALRFLVETATEARNRVVLDALRHAVRGGGSLAHALAAHPRSFTRLMIGLMRAGEAGGTLAPTLDRLATLLERQRSLAATVRTALVYPSLLLMASIGSVTLLLTEVLPQFVPLFQQSGAALPTPTRLLIATGDAVSAYGLWMLLSALGLGVAFRIALQQPSPRLAADRLLLRLPVAGGLTRDILAARLTRTFGTLMVNGVPLIEALLVCRDALGNRAAIAAIDSAIGAVRDGAGLATPLQHGAVFPARTIHLLRLGEETARLGPMALRAAEIHEERVRHGVQRLIALLVPGITVLMGAIVAAIVAALLLAMLSINDLAT